MKNVLFILTSLLLFTSCNKNQTVNPIDQLPPRTTEGKNTFGCLIDGKVFKPKGALFGPPSRSSSYQYIHNKGNSYYNFQVSAGNNNDKIGISINLKLLNFDDLKENEQYLITVYKDGGVANYDTGGLTDYRTSHKHTGILTITHYDYPNRIVSGKFEFQVEMNGKIVRITDGRFDMKFSI